MNVCVIEKTVIRHYRDNKAASAAKIPFIKRIKQVHSNPVTFRKTSPDIKAALCLIISTNAIALSALFKNIAELF